MNRLYRSRLRPLREGVPGLPRISRRYAPSTGWQALEQLARQACDQTQEFEPEQAAA
jgi:hypothetical protein